MNGRQERALRTPWTGEDHPTDYRELISDPYKEHRFWSSILTVERCGCLNHGHGIWHASVCGLQAAEFGGDAARLDDEEQAVARARRVLDGVGQPDWELVLWSGEPDRRTAHVRVAVTAAEGLLIPASCPVAPNDHEEEGVWIPRVLAVGA